MDEDDTYTFSVDKSEPQVVVIMGDHVFYFLPLDQTRRDLHWSKSQRTVVRGMLTAALGILYDGEGD